MKKQVSAGIVVYYKPTDGSEVEYLLLHYVAGHWDLPKGKLEAGETKIQAAIRELEEETGLTEIAIHEGFEESLMYQFRDKHGNPIEKTVHFFVGQVPHRNSPVKISREHQGYDWLPFNKAMQRLAFSNAQQVLQRAHQFIASL